MAYTDIDKSDDYFNTVLYTGNSSTQAIAVGFQSDWVWCKPRTNTGSHFLSDSVRGGTKVIVSNTTATEITRSNNIQSFTSTGYTLGADGTSNYNGDATVSWNWKAGTSFTNDASATGIGTIDSTGSVNQDAGFSIVSFDLSGQSGNETIKHGLNSAPKVIITKRLSGGAGDWTSYFGAIGNSYLVLNNTSAAATSSSFMNNTAPTSSVFTVGDPSWWGANPFIAYCFSEKKGYSKFGSYTGNGSSNGTFVYTGFKPAFMLFKRTDGATSWIIMDNKRNTYNPAGLSLFPNSSDAEYNYGDRIDILSNGFKNRNSGSDFNASGGSYIYMAFAENPFVTSTGVPACAR
jgi:hypothetical protein